ncbi:MAG: pyrimidine 5'-nucleotidase [Methylotenera sp.]|uniref:pyrimidine 5'-nucleotidase n=1 Tax=Methylotenera sp. TaxID=2051956 RepID=UPI00271FBD6C|nr:pyrimidine 5'-nucleotidase [Methylotenera sp.]MDO9392917.1 pyrimidine 5'-nucleotidase [Methylotenera sp.]MDP1521796.1 pyrimidine 5'-nucleotidase [Methylotenera sp.]MDP3307332.1 pyrimidine 5'-nucleotidase [Methylotenera sp.]MDP3818427.1 pyrimidine 5'-nucleotidase [Methylotenera sp.]MDZ4211247.1 pyrimidine 5'-nucleotidase [Methylotenera sp.]
MLQCNLLQSNLTQGRNSRVWIFDLDDTLHNASAHIFPVMNRAMTQYIMDKLELDESAAHGLRQHYWRIYGATLKGLMRHHGTDPQHFLHETHTLKDLPDMVLQVKRLRHMLQSLSGRKLVFTNAPRNYALRVLDLMGIGDCFELIFSVESTKFHAKPSLRGFQMLLKTIKVKASDCVMLEDNLPALMTAKRLGMRTIWVTKKPQKPNFVDYRLNDVLALTHLKL